MTKTKNGAERATQTGTESLRASFEKAARGYEQFVSVGTVNAEAWLKSANVAGKGIAKIHEEFYAFSRGVIEDGVAAAQALFAAKNVQEAFAIQTGFARSAFESSVDGVAKIGDIALTIAKDAAEPIQERVSAFSDLVQKRAA